MNRNHIARQRIGLLLAAAVLPSSAMAQEAQTVTPPAVTPAPAEPAAAAPVPAASPTIQFAPNAPVVQTVPERPVVTETPEAEAPAADPAPARRVNRAAAPAPASRAARAAPPAAASAAPAAAPPVVSEPAAATAPAPIAAAAPSGVDPIAPAAAPVEAPVAEPKGDEVSSAAAWGTMGIVALAILGLVGFLLARRRRAKAAEHEETYYPPDEDAAVEAAAVAAAPTALVEQPAAVAPIVAADTGDAAGRPWLDIGLRPIRAGATAAGGSVEVALTVSNTGDLPAHDVRVSTWMLNSPQSSDNEHAMIEARANARTADIELEPGADQVVDSTLELTGEQLGGAFRPLVVAEARYPLPDGGEGRIAATFEIGVGDEVAPISTDGAGMREDVAARLQNVLERS